MPNLITHKQTGYLIQPIFSAISVQVHFSINHPLNFVQFALTYDTTQYLYLYINDLNKPKIFDKDFHPQIPSV